MFRKLLAIALLGGLLYLAFQFSRNVEHDEDLVATLVFDSAEGVKPGTEVVEKDERIGEVTGVGTIGEKAAVTVTILREHRNRIFTDSGFEIDGDPVAIRVISTISVGPPLENDAVVVARPDKMAKLIAKGSEKLAPHVAAARDKALEMIDHYDAEAFHDQLDEWAGDVPKWKAEGKETFRRNVSELETTVEDIESALRRIKRDAEADKIRKAFDRWVEEIGDDD